MLRAPVQDGCPQPLVYEFPPEILHAVSTRRGGVSPDPYKSLNMGISTGDDPANVRANRLALATEFAAPMHDVLVGRLSHGVEVSVFDVDDQQNWPVHRVPNDSPAGSERIFRSDAAISNVPGLYFFLTFADCVPLLFYDPVNRAIGAAHAGWRGSALGMAGAVIRAMQATFGTRPDDMLAAIGPSIGPCCYSVRRDVIESFGRSDVLSAHEEYGQTYYLDLWTTNERQMKAAGMDAERIQNRRLCTSCEVETFYSHRAEAGKTGRFALLSGLR